MFFITAAKSPDKPKNPTDFKIKLHYSKTLQTFHTKQIIDSVTARDRNSKVTIQGITCKNDTQETEHNYEFLFASVRMV